MFVVSLAICGPFDPLDNNINHITSLQHIVIQSFYARHILFPEGNCSLTITDDCKMVMAKLPESAVQCILLQTVPHSANILSTFPDELDPRASLSCLLSIVPSTVSGTTRTYS